MDVSDACRRVFAVQLYRWLKLCVSHPCGGPFCGVTLAKTVCKVFVWCTQNLKKSLCGLEDFLLCNLCFQRTFCGVPLDCEGLHAMLSFTCSSLYVV